MHAAQYQRMLYNSSIFKGESMSSHHMANERMIRSLTLCLRIGYSNVLISRGLIAS